MGPVRPLNSPGEGDTASPPKRDLGIAYSTALNIWVRRFREAQEVIRGMDRDHERSEAVLQEHIDLLVRENDKLRTENERLKAGLPAEDGSTGD